MATPNMHKMLTSFYTSQDSITNWITRTSHCHLLLSPAHILNCYYTSE